MRVRIPLAGMPNQRDFDSLQSLIEGKDQRFRSVYLIPIDNPITGERKVYVEKRPGFEEVLQPAEGCPGQFIFYSTTEDKFITSFCGSDVYVGTTDVGTTNPTLNQLLIAGGQSTPSGTALKTTERYNMSTDTVLSGTSLSVITNTLQGAGNETRAIIVGYSAESEHEKYTYETDVVTSATAEAVPRSYNGATSNSTTGLYMGGRNSSSVSQDDVEKYTFSDDTITSGTNLSAVRYEWGQGAGNATDGYIFGGRGVSNALTGLVEKYTYSSDTVVSVSGITATTGLGACGTDTDSYIAGGSIGGFFGAQTRIDRYNHSSDTWFTAGELFPKVAEQGLIALMASGNDDHGYFCGGQNVGSVQDSVYKYSFEDETASVSATLLVDRQLSSATSSNPGWF